MNRNQLIVAESIKQLLELFPTIAQLEKQIHEKPTDQEFLANTAFLCRKSLEMLKSVEKCVNELSAKAENAACLNFATSEELKYSTDWCTVSPNPSLYVKFPSSPKEYGFEAFVKLLPTDCIRPHYPSVEERINDEIKAGNQIPFGLGSNGDGSPIKAATLKLRITGKKDL